MKEKIIVTLNIIQLCAMVIGLGALMAAPDARKYERAFIVLGIIFGGCFVVSVLAYLIRVSISR